MTIRLLAPFALAGLLGLSAFIAPAAAAPRGLQDVFAEQVHRCWSPPRAADGARLSAKVRIVLAPDGSLAAPPTVVRAPRHRLGPSFVAAVRRAVEACAPYRMPVAADAPRRTLDVVFTTRRI